MIVFIVFLVKFSVSCDTEFEFWYSIDFPFNDLQNSINVSSFYDCIDLCYEKSDCNAFGYSGIDGICWLKGKAGKYNLYFFMILFLYIQRKIDLNREYVFIYFLPFSSLFRHFPPFRHFPSFFHHFPVSQFIPPFSYLLRHCLT